jgi:hypothetical protein
MSIPNSTMKAKISHRDINNPSDSIQVEKD